MGWRLIHLWYEGNRTGFRSKTLKLLDQFLTICTTLRGRFSSNNLLSLSEGNLALCGVNESEIIENNWVLMCIFGTTSLIMSVVDVTSLWMIGVNLRFYFDFDKFVVALILAGTAFFYKSFKALCVKSKTFRKLMAVTRVCWTFESIGSRAEQVGYF